MESEAKLKNEAAVTTIEDLYKYFEILSEITKENAEQHVETYLKLISGTKSGAKEKQLASQFITRFFKYFPNESPIAIEAIFDLCEDADVSIRRTAVKDLASLSKDCNVENLSRIADILTQLLQTEEFTELNQVQSSLYSVFKLDPKSVLKEIFKNINTAELDIIRKRAIKFLVNKIPILLKDTSEDPALFKGLEDLVINHVKLTLVDVDGEEFIHFIQLLTSLPSMNTLTGRQDLVNIIMAQSELDRPFEENDTERLMILLSCLQQALPFFSKDVQSTSFVNSYMENVLVIFSKISDDCGISTFEIIKSFAELCTYYSGQVAVVNSIQNLEILFNLLISYLPKPNEALVETENQEAKEDDVKFNFSYVECLMYAFHALARYHPEFLAAEANKDRLKDFRWRLQYFAKGTQNYIKELRNSINTEETEENKIRRVAFKVTTNIDALIKDLFHNPPIYKCAITLSWKSAERNPIASKRSLSVSSIENNHHQNGDSNKKPTRGVYQPPTGKYSTSTDAEFMNLNLADGKRRTFSHGDRGRGKPTQRGRRRF